MKSWKTTLAAVTVSLLVCFLVGCTTNVYKAETVGKNGLTNYHSFSRKSLMTKQNIGKITIETADGTKVTIGGVEQEQISGIAAVTEAAVRGAVKGAKPGP